MINNNNNNGSNSFNTGNVLGTGRPGGGNNPSSFYKEGGNMTSRKDSFNQGDIQR